MMKQLLWFCAISVLTLSLAFAGSGKKQRGVQQPVNFVETNTPATAAKYVASDPGPRSLSAVGTSTTLSGFYDYQINGGAPQHIRVNPANGNIHVVYMMAEDSANSNPSRRVAYAFSSNGGTSWNNFTNVRVPARRGGFPTLDLLQGANAGLPAIANHNDPGTGLRTVLYVDSPEGTGAFSELNTPPALGSDEPIWPYVAGPSDGSIVVHASRSAGGTNHLNRTTDFATWQATWTSYPLPNNSGGRYATAANATGRVGSLLNAVGTGVFLLESTNNGVSWPATSNQIYPANPPGRIAGVDTFQAWVGSDIVYKGNTAYVAINELNVGTSDPTDGSQILFWSAATGFKVAATRANTPGSTTVLNRAQANHRTIGYPAIGMSGDTVVIVYQGFKKDTSAVGFNYSDIFVVVSTNGGNNWTAPRNLTNTTNLDERYPSISKWNQRGFANITWQEDTQPGSHAFSDNAPISRSTLVYYKWPLVITDVRVGAELPVAYRLEQNFPNPFNPSTKISYTVPSGTNVSLKVYNALGQEVATLVNDYRSVGNYEAEFSAANLASGVYYYTLKAGSFTATKKMVLMK